MSSEETQGTTARPSLETLHMLSELASFLVGRQDMGSETKRLLEASVANQKAQQQLFLAAVAAHKMHRFPKLLQAIDFLREKMTDPAVLAAVASDPRELRKHLEKLLEMEGADLTFLTQAAGTQAEKHGRSTEPEKQYNLFLGNTIAGSALLPADLTPDGRRNMTTALQALLTMAVAGGPPKPPRSTSKQDRQDLVARVLNVKGRANGNGVEDHKP